MIRLKRCGLLAALMTSSALPSLAQEAGGDGGRFEPVPGTVVVVVPETEVTYQIPVSLAAEVCPEIDDAYLATDFEGTTEVVCEVPESVAVENDFAALPNGVEGDDDGTTVDEATGAGADAAGGTGVDAETGAGTDAAPGIESDAGTETDGGGTDSGAGTEVGGTDKETETQSGD